MNLALCEYLIDQSSADIQQTMRTSNMLKIIVGISKGDSNS